MNVKQRRYFLAAALVIIAAIVIVFLAGRKNNNTSSSLNTKPPQDAVAVIDSYIQAREDSVGADQPSATSWISIVKPLVTADWYSKLQPNPNSSTSSLSNEYVTAHSNGYIVKASVDSCVWDLEVGRPLLTAGTISCQLTDITTDQKSGSAVPISNLPFGWTRSGQQSPAIFSMLKQGNSWLITADVSNESE